MKEYPNFYENLTEARARLLRTIVLYGDTPCFVLAITDHMKDGIFRMWLDPVGIPMSPELKSFRQTASNHGPEHPLLPGQLDALLTAHPNCGIMRKHMNSPKFRRFRPFPLGMCHAGTQLYYIERQPIRPKMEQGLTKNACSETLITAGSRRDNPKHPMQSVDIYGPSFKDCILGDHFPAQQALDALNDPRCDHDALAFHREFALVRGPLEMLFLAYRSDIIGTLPYNDFSVVKLGRDYRYCSEVVEELRLFAKIL